jgi:Na+-transporting NADH:ubiquinone oxidoreductase subunit C
VIANGKVTQGPGGNHGWHAIGQPADPALTEVTDRKYVIPSTHDCGPITLHALNDDKATIYGAYFNHESETAGLGAEIKDNLKWQQQFKGKKLFKGSDTQHIALAVEKKIDDPATQVDAVTGATLTSNGVTLMFKDCLGKYIKFLNEK